MTNSALALKASASSDSSVKRSHKAMLNFKGVKKVQANNVPREETALLTQGTGSFLDKAQKPKAIDAKFNKVDHTISHNSVIPQKFPKNDKHVKNIDNLFKRQRIRIKNKEFLQVNKKKINNLIENG